MSAHVSTPGIHLQELVLDAASTPEQKADCLKLLRVVIKNLADPVKAQDAKYRQFRLENAKVQQKLLPLPVAVEYLKAIGFVEANDEGEKVLRVVDTTVNVALMQTCLMEVSSAIDMVLPASGNKKKLKHCDSSCSLEEKKTDDVATLKRSSSSLSNSSSMTGKLSEKQKARLLLEEKAKKEKQEAKAARAKNIAMLKQDKFVRKNDPNWKSGVSAACAKSGDGISTFRDRHGEH